MIEEILEEVEMRPSDAFRNGTASDRVYRDCAEQVARALGAEGENVTVNP